MPFRYAPHVMVAMIVIAIVAFWPRYFSSFSTAPWAFHYHGVTATIWMTICALQSWSIHARRRQLHRTMGIAGLAFFPFFLAGTVAVVLSMSRATSTDPFYKIYGVRLGIMDATTPFIIAWLFYDSLSHRKSVQLHARYLMAIPLLLVMPIVSRLIDHLIPPLVMHGPQDFPLFAKTIHLSNAASLACAAGLYAMAPRYGRPFLIAGAAMLLQSIAFDTVGLASAWRSLFVLLGEIPALPTLLTILSAAAVLEWAGWNNGKPPAREKPSLLNA